MDEDITMVNLAEFPLLLEYKKFRGNVIYPYPVIVEIHKEEG